MISVSMVQPGSWFVTPFVDDQHNPGSTIRAA
jgi:hypothetical protein